MGRWPVKFNIPMPPSPRRRPAGTLTEADRAAWARYAGVVKPLPGRTCPDPPPMPAGAETAPPPAASPQPPRRAARILPPLTIGAAPPGLDTGTWQRFQAGRLAVNRRLDLHGRTADAAHAALEDFLHHARAARLRCVEVITGQGRGTDGAGGVLRRELPLWLNLPRLRPCLLAAVHPPRNPGAVLLLLRRVRDG